MPDEDENDRCDECMDGRHTNCTDVEDGSCCCPPGPDRHFFPEEVDQVLSGAALDDARGER